MEDVHTDAEYEADPNYNNPPNDPLYTFSRPLDMEGQEFSRFRGIRSRADVRDFLAEYGMLRLKDLVRPDAVQGSYLWPAWLVLLTHEPHYAEEWVGDWIRQSGLLTFAFSLWGLLAVPRARQTLAAVLERAAEKTGTFRDRFFVTHDYMGRSWPVVSFLDGADRAGLRIDLEGLLVISAQPDFPPYDPVSDDPVKAFAFETRYTWWEIDLTDKTTIADALRGLLSPWLRLVHADAIPGPRGLHPGHSVPPQLLAVLWLQLANAICGDLSPKACAWERCPGPPNRPGLFLWRSGRSRSGIKHRDAIYCDPRCAHAASMARTRSSPAYARKKHTETREEAK